MRRTSVLASVLALVSLAACGPATHAAQPTTPPATPAATTTSPAPALSLGPTLSVAPEATTPQPLATPTSATAGGVTPGTGLSAYYAAKVAWSTCNPSAAAVDFIDLTGFQCAAVRVPLDYRHPAGRKISLGIARLPATGSHRIGSLLIDPGGPGVSGLDYLTQATSAIPAAVRARFDIVGFDPRGVGVSAGLNCLTVAQFDANVAAPVNPTTPAQVAAAVARAALLAKGCAKTAGWELPYLGTTYAARDMDLIRSAVGDAKLSYLGKSYGTELGAVYADEFPTKVRALVLDGALPPGLDVAGQARGQGVGFEGDLHDFLADCVRHTSCPFSGTAAHARTQFNAFVGAVAAQALQTRLGRPLAVGNAVNGITAALYSTASWPALRVGLSQALKGDGSLLLAYSDSFAGRHASRYESTSSAFPAISCMDVPSHFTVAQVAAYAKSWAVGAPLYGPLEAWGLLTCNGWVPTATRLPDRVSAKGAPPIVVVGSTGDPATPYAWAVDLAHQLNSGRLVTYVGDGHTVYGGGRSSCVDTAVNAYLIALTPPKASLRCT
ncbi:alpha/beta hydrolase [Acidothermaceae bacterium B102]|nr:alpha/beta hydrolase [Acidothermaceae bacterium B102]